MYYSYGMNGKARAEKYENIANLLNLSMIFIYVKLMV